MADGQVNPNSIVTQLASGKRYGLQDSYIAVMGVTGSGKSTFISRCIGGSGAAKIGHDLNSCTSEVESFTFQYNQRTIQLIDTPGFDDTHRTDSDVLKDIAFWLNTAYRENIRLSGIVYLHPINVNRVTGSALKNLRMFRKLCGTASLPSVVLATTMWGEVDEAKGDERLDQLKGQEDFWGGMMSQGSHVFRHDDTRLSAMNIVNYILDLATPTVLAIQRQMVDEKLSLDETAAGQELQKELLEQKAQFEKKLKEAQEEMKEALEEGNRQAIEEMAKEQERFQKRLDEASEGTNKLKISMESLLKEKEEEHLRAIQRLEEERLRSLRDAKLTAEQVDELRGRIKARDDAAEEDRRKYSKEMDDMALKFSKQSLESQASLQWYIAEQQRLKLQEDSASLYSATTAGGGVGGTQSVFEHEFDAAAGQAMGAAAGTAIVGTGAVAGAAMLALCNVM